MSTEDVQESHPLRLLDRETRLPEAELSVILARSGVGKSAAMINFALETMAQGHQVLHFCAEMSSEKVHQYYTEVFAEFRRNYHWSTEVNWEQLNHFLTVVTYRDADKMVNDLEKEILTMIEFAHASPQLILVDGLDFNDHTDTDLATIAKSASKHGIKTLASLRIHRGNGGRIDADDPALIAARHSGHVYFMEPAQSRINIEFRVRDKWRQLPIFFCPQDLIFKVA